MNDYLESRIDYLQWDNDRLREENEKLKEKVEQMQENYENLNDVYTETLRENKKMKTELEKEYELVEVNWYKAPRYKWREMDSIIRYSRQCIKRWFPYLYQDEEGKED